MNNERPIIDSITPRQRRHLDLCQQFREADRSEEMHRRGWVRIEDVERAVQETLNRPARDDVDVDAFVAVVVARLTAERGGGEGK